jgi:hypothetical protein
MTRQLKSPSNDTKYPAVWAVDPPLADWLDRLHEWTPLATLNESLAKLADEWAQCSATLESRIKIAELPYARPVSSKCC